MPNGGRPNIEMLPLATCNKFTNAGGLLVLIMKLKLKYIISIFILCSLLTVSCSINI